MEQNKTINSLLPLGVTNAMSTVNSAVTNVANNVMKNTTKLANNLPSFNAFTNNIANTVSNVGSGITNTVSDVGSGISNTVSNLGSGFVTNTASKNKGLLNGLPSLPDASSLPWIPIAFFVTLVVIFVVLLVKFNEQIRDGYLTIVNKLRESLGYSSQPPPPIESTTPTTQSIPQDSSQEQPSGGVVEKILPPSGNSQVFNVSKNTFTYYDAEPLCRALGAELATYEQVKDAWEKGADWCNYGWVKGQMAVYPTQKETWEKLQAGPEEQRMACGNPGLNGGFFDNPELRYGVNCYGVKPSQSKHDATQVAKGTPQSPDALEFDKKVAAYRSQSDNIGVLPFNTNKWSS